MNRFRMGVLMDEPADPAPSGGGNPPTFDPAAFQRQMADLINTTVNGAIKNLEKKLKPPTPPADPPAGDPPADPPVDPKQSKLERELARLRTDLDSERKARTETETRAKNERLQGALRTELLKHVPAERVDAAMRIFGPDVRYSEDGAMVGGADEATLAEFIGTEISKHEYLLPPKPVGGAGASNQGRRGTPAPGIADIKTGMSDDTRRAIVAAIAEAMPKDNVTSIR